jgi:hypothetical protein
MPTTINAINALIIVKLLKKIESLIPATKHSLEMKPTPPIKSPATNETHIGACMLPGPSVDNIKIEGKITNMPSATMTKTGSTMLSVRETVYVRFNEYPLLRKNMPPKMPPAKPKRPTMAFKSPPAILRAILKGQPRKISAPIIIANPKINLVTGAEPP